MENITRDCREPVNKLKSKSGLGVKNANNISDGEERVLREGMCFVH